MGEYDSNDKYGTVVFYIWYDGDVYKIIHVNIEKGFNSTEIYIFFYCHPQKRMGTNFIYFPTTVRHYLTIF